MIQSKTARKMMYSWHGGQSCPLYATASSGLVADWDALLYACNDDRVTVTDSSGFVLAQRG